MKRAKARLKDEELEVTHQLSAAIRRMRDQQVLAQTQFNALKAARDQVTAAETGYRVAQSVPLDVVLDSLSRRTQAEIDYGHSSVEYQLAMSEVHFRKGSLLEMRHYEFTERQPPNVDSIPFTAPDTYDDAALREDADAVSVEERKR